MRLSEWYKTFLTKRHLEFPDGRSLYEYRVSDNEFNILKVVLINCPINHDSYQLWDVCFVLYASEWWRRNYSEGAWSWEPILKSVDKRIDKPALRSSLVESGFKKWNRKIFKDSEGKSDYLVTIIVECGLPTETLTKEGAWLKRLITQSFKEYHDISSSENSPQDFVRRIAEEITVPKSLQKVGFYSLIGRIVMELRALKLKYQLHKVKSPLELLDVEKNDWREVFPIQIDSPAGKKFLDELLTEIALIRDPKVYPFSMKRILLQSQEGWKIRSLVDLSNGYYDHEDLRLSSDKFDLLPSRFEVLLVSSQGEEKIVSTALKTSKGGKNVVKISGSIQIDGENTFDQWKLQLSCLDVTINLPLPGGEDLNKEAPWIFAMRNEQWFLESQASYRTHLEKVIIISNNRIKGAGNLRLISAFQEWGSIFELHGNATLSINDCQYKIVTRAEKTDEKYAYVLTGSTYHYTSLETPEVYLGVPTINKFNHETLRRSISGGDTRIRFLGDSNNWQTPKPEHHGLMEIRLLGKDSEVLYSKKIAVLPSGFNIVTNSNGVDRGKIILESSPLFQVTVRSNSIASSISKTNNGHEVSIEANDHVPPEFIAISLLKQNQFGEIRLNIPFPAKGSRFFSKDGRLLKRTDTLFLDQLHGVRLYIFNSNLSSKKYSIKLTLGDQYLQDAREISWKQDIKVDPPYKEIPLINFVDKLRTLFCSNLDSSIKFEVAETLGQETASIQIKRYATEKLTQDFDSGTVIANMGDANVAVLQLNTFRLDMPSCEQKVEVLKIVDKDNGVVKWRFNDGSRGAGIWLICPGENSEIVFRSMIWIVGNEHKNFAENNSIELISHAAYIKDVPSRISALTTLAERISEDYANENWDEVDLLWKRTSHLPLATFNLWTAISQSHKALVALFLHQDFALIERFTQEFVVIWECISINDWISSFRNYKLHYESKFPQLAGELLRDKIEDLEGQLKLGCLAKILCEEFFNDPQEFSFLKRENSQILKRLIAAQYSGADGTPGLLHQEGRWPEDLKDEIGNAIRSLPEEIMDLFPKDQPTYRKCVTNLPIILAFKSLNLISYPQELSPIQVFKLRTIKEFHEDWFNFIYNSIQGYGWVNNKIKV
jgi:hypothetical protein